MARLHEVDCVKHDSRAFEGWLGVVRVAVPDGWLYVTRALDVFGASLQLSTTFIPDPTAEHCKVSALQENR